MTVAPYLYGLTVERGEQRETLSVGLRTTEFDPGRGFLLNGGSGY